MADMMKYPKTPIEFIESYSFKDSDEIYTNGIKLVPVFRVTQMLEHYYEPLKEKATPKKKNIYAPLGLELCPTCGRDTYREFFKYCPHCGQALEREYEE